MLQENERNINCLKITKQSAQPGLWTESNQTLKLEQEWKKLISWWIASDTGGVWPTDSFAEEKGKRCGRYSGHT